MIELSSLPSRPMKPGEMAAIRRADGVDEVEIIDSLENMRGDSNNVDAAVVTVSGEENYIRFDRDGELWVTEEIPEDGCLCARCRANERS